MRAYTDRNSWTKDGAMSLFNPAAGDAPAGATIHSGFADRDITTGRRIDAAPYDTTALDGGTRIPAGKRGRLIDAGSPARACAWDILDA